MSEKKTGKNSLIDRLQDAAEWAHESGVRGRGVVYRTIMDALELLKSQCIYDPQYETNVNLNHDDYVRVGDVLDCFTGMDLNDDAVFHGVCLLKWAMSKRSISKKELLKKLNSEPPVLMNDLGIF